MNRFLPLTAVVLASVALAQQPNLDDRFQRAYYQEHALKDLDQAIETYRGVFNDALAAKQRGVAAKAKLREALCERQRGREVEAVALLEGLVKEFGDQRAVAAEAKDALAALGGPRRTLRVYDVNYLLTRAPEAVPLTGMRLEASPYHDGGAGGAGAAGGFSFSDEEESMPAGVAVDPDTLIELIEENLAHDSWEGNARLEVENGNLIVVNTAEVHREVEALLARLHALRGRSISFDVRSVLISRAGYQALKLGPGGARALSPQQVRALGAQLTAKQAIELERRQLSTPNRIGTEAATPRRVDFLGTYEVNQTGVIPVLNPVVEQGTQATALWLRPTLVADGKSMLLEVHARSSRWNTEASQQLSLDKLVELDLPSADYVALEETLLVKDGQPVIVGGVQATQTVEPEVLAALGWDPQVLSDARVLFVVHPHMETPAEAKGEAPLKQGRRELRVYNVALITGERREPQSEHLRGLLYDLNGYDDEGSPTLHLDVIMEMLEENVSPDSWEHPSNWCREVGQDIIAINQTPAVHASVRSFLSALERGPRASQTVAFELFDLEIPAARLDALFAAAPGGRGSQRLSAQAVEALLAEDSTEVIRWGAASTINGSPVAFESTRTARYLKGSESSSGGTGQVVSQVLQPVTDVVRSGWSLAAVPNALRDGRVALNLDYRVETLHGFKRVDLGFAKIGLPQLTTDSKQISSAIEPKQVLVVAGEVRAGRGRLVLVRVRVDKHFGE